MEVHIVFHEANPLALDGVGDDSRRSPLDLLRLFKGGQELRNVVTIHFDNMPAKGTPFVRIRAPGSSPLGSSHRSAACCSR
jgi:hypothetical protein